MSYHSRQVKLRRSLDHPICSWMRLNTAISYYSHGGESGWMSPILGGRVGHAGGPKGVDKAP